MAERLAAWYLCRHGLSRLEKNFHSTWGEIDIVMLDKRSLIRTDSEPAFDNWRAEDTLHAEGGILVFVEVRFRSNHTFGSAEETVDWRKQEKIRRTALVYLAKHNEYMNLPVRFDVVAVTQRNYRPKIMWIRDAFQ